MAEIAGRNTAGDAAVPDANLRQYRSSDFETLYKIDQLCFPRGIAYGRAELKIYLASPGARCLLAEIENETVGFILAGQYANSDDNSGHIITLDVLKAYRRKKIATLLLHAAEEDVFSRGVRRMCLETATSNEPAIAFWRKHGYRETGIARNYYGQGLDAFEMDKILGAPTERMPGAFKVEDT